MSKKRNRQPDANGDTSEGSTESCEETSTAGKCSHISKAVNLGKLKKGLKKGGLGAECVACKKVEENEEKNDEDGVETLSGPLWICLRCGHQGCGRTQNQHAIEHYQKPQSDCHCMVVDTYRWSVWCYLCEMEVSADSRKRLLETVEFVKRTASSARIPIQTKMPVMSCQKAMSEIDKDKQTFLNNLPKVGGLANLGNTCFFNAVLQCLAQTPFLVKVLDDSRTSGQEFVLPGGKHKSNENDETVELPPIKGTLERCGTFTSIFWKTLTEMQNTTGHQTYRPTELLSAFKKKTMQCMDGGQHDSHELLRHLLEIVRNEDLRRYQTVILKEVGLSGKTNPHCVEDGLKSCVKFYGNQASARLLGAEFVFRGVLVSTIECLDCHHSSQRTEPFFDLSLPVMADKPQPPVLKRKNNGAEDALEMLCNEFSAVLSKHQMKKEKVAARKNRRRRESYNNYVLIPSNDENQFQGMRINVECSYTFEEKNDADVEDNIEAEGPTREIGESGYSSEKVSAVASPVSPAPHNIHDHASSQSLKLPSMNGLPLTTTLLLSPIDGIDAPGMKDITSNDAFSPSLTDVSMTDLTQPRLLSEGDRVESSGSPDNGNGAPGLSLSGSLAINSDLTSPEAPTVSPLGSSASSKDSPTSPLSSTMNGEDHLAEDATVKEKEDKEKDDSGTWIGDHRCRIIFPLTGFPRDLECGPQPEPEPEPDREACNGVNDITSGMSRLGISNSAHQSPTRYSTKEGECSIQSCLNQFTALELMSGSNKVSCEACTAREKKMKEGSTRIVCTPSTKQYLISKVPPVLILHLKRFQTQRVGFKKVMKHVTFPTLLDLSPVCKGHRKRRIYALYGVVVHSGTLHGGHYVAYVKSRQPLSPDDPRWRFLPPRDATADDASNGQSSDSEGEEAAAKASSSVEPPPGRWYFVSDSHVAEVDESAVLHCQAYLLFYERIL